MTKTNILIGYQNIHTIRLTNHKPSNKGKSNLGQVSNPDLLNTRSKPSNKAKAL